MFPNGVLSAGWRGGIQMTCVLTAEDKESGGKSYVYVREEACVSTTSPVPICSHDCVCVPQIHAKALSVAYAFGPMYSSLLRNCSSARKYLLAACCSAYGAFVQHKQSK